MTDFDTNSYSDAELFAEFDRMFPQGFAGPEVVQELAPDGWENSPLLAAFHPSVSQMSFYMGTIWLAQRADLAPVYQTIFRRLRGRRLDWIYHFPRMHAIDLRPLKEALDRKHQPDWLNYSPSEALAKEAEQKKHDQELAEFRDSLDEGYREALEEALNAPPPTTVKAYEAVYERFPRGWPPRP
jgi:hypothetical protein